MSLAIAPTISPPIDDAAIPDVPIHRLTVAQYQAMVGAGILAEADRVELLEGWLVPQMSKNPPHSSVTRRLRRTLERLLSTGWLVLSQDPITTEDSSPEPDVCVARGDETTYEQRHPAADEVALVIEVADSSLRHDREIKMRIYAQAAIPTYWIVNLVEHQVEVYTDPSGPAEQPGYAHRQDYALSETLPLVLDGDEIDKLPVNELLR